MKKITPGMPGKNPTSAEVPPAQVLLYVEDDDMNWEVAQMRLAKRYRLHRARNGIEACKLVRELGASLSAVLMDIQLQGSDIDGTALTMLFKGKLPASLVPPYAVGIDPIAAPVVYLTANGVRFEQSELLRTGASFVVSKPVDFVSLAVGLNRLILERRAGIRTGGAGTGGASS